MLWACPVENGGQTNKGLPQGKYPGEVYCPLKKMERDNWSAKLKFRGMLADLAHKLTLEEGKSLAFIYGENIDIDECIEVMDRITKRRRIVHGRREDLEHLKMSLDKVGRSDLKTVVDEYIKLHHCQQPLLEPVTTTHHVHMVTESDTSRSTVSGLGVG